LSLVLYGDPVIIGKIPFLSSESVIALDRKNPSTSETVEVGRGKQEKELTV
jgi:hypothetical protein